MSIIGSVFERKALGSSNPKQLSSSGASGFPPVQHRSKSTFSQRKHPKSDVPSQPLPSPVPSTATTPLDNPPEPLDQLLVNIGKGNDSQIDSMSREEVKSEQTDILEHFGADLIQKFKNRKRNPKNGALKFAGLQEVPITEEKPQISRPTTPALISPPTPRVGTPRQLRFAALNPEDVYVYPSAPSSPKKAVLALPPPSDTDTDAISLGSFKNFPTSSLHHTTEASQDTTDTAEQGDEIEGSPEYIRQRFFPTYRQEEPSLEWITSDPKPSQSEDSSSTLSTLRFDLTGSPIPPDKVESLPTHLGLHHHGDPGARAGYTLDDIFMLSRSTVSVQRNAMVELLCGVSRWGSSQPISAELEILRKRILSVGILALTERSLNTIVRGIELTRSCLVDWSPRPNPSLVDIQSTLPNLLLSVPPLLERDDMERDAKIFIIQILSSVAFSAAIGYAILQTHSLVASLIREFITSVNPSPIAISLFTQLARFQRGIALDLITRYGVSDALVRFLLENHHLSADTKLIEETLTFYSTVGRYGLGISSITRSPEGILALGRIGSWSMSSHDLQHSEIQRRYFQLLSLYMTCAIDPHSTTPIHSITWTNIVGWGWREELLSSFRSAPVSLEISATLLGTAAAYCEASKANALPIDRKKDEAQFGTIVADPRAVSEVQSVLSQFETETWNLDQETFAAKVDLLANYSRLILVCQSHQTQIPLCSRIIKFLHRITSDATIWARPGEGHRPISTLLYQGVQLSLAVFPSDITLPLAAMQCFLRGDEELALGTLDSILSLLSSHPQWQSLGIRTSVLKPFWMYSIEPWSIKKPTSDEEGVEDSEEVEKIAPYNPSPNSLRYSQTCLVPWDAIAALSAAASSTLGSNPVPSLPRPPNISSGLPLSSGWLFKPLDHLLASGTSPVFRATVSLQRATEQHVDEEWNPTEKEIVRGCLAAARICQLSHQRLPKDEVILGCMKVFMLEDSVNSNLEKDEVFRDDEVRTLMNDLISPFTFTATANSTSTSPPLPIEPSTLESIHPSFYTFYTSFIGLYDQVSFGHPLFSTLLLCPLSMNYASDYRNLFWSDYSHIVKLVSAVPAANIPVTRTRKLAEWFWPLEDDNRVLGGQVRALNTNNANGGFVRMIAIHHVAGNIWSDMWMFQDSPEQDVHRNARSSQILKSLFQRCGAQTLRDVICYRQVPPSSYTIPPSPLDDDVKSARVERATRLVGEGLGSRVKELMHA